MSSRKRRRTASGRADTDGARPVRDADRTPPAERPRGPFGALLGSGPSALPPLGRSLGRGFLAVAAQPALVLTAIVLVATVWIGLVALGFEGRPAPLAQLLSIPPISTLFDAGVVQSMFGLGLGMLLSLAVVFVIRSVVIGVLTGAIVDSLETGRIGRYGILRGIRAIPTVFGVEIVSFSALILGNNVFPLLGAGLGLLGAVAALVGALFFLGFAPAAAVREGRGVVESMRRSGRAARLPGSNHVLFCALYFFLALVTTFVAPGGSEITANPPLSLWVFVMFMNVLHLAFMAAFAYRWVVAEPEVPDQPVQRRRQAPPPARARSRR